MILTQGPKDKFLKVMSYAFSFSLLIQGLSFARQVLVATSLGLSRNLDIYYTALAISTVIGLALNPLYDNVMTSFVREHSLPAVRKFSLNVLISCIFVATCCCAILAIGENIILKIYGAGFTSDERLLLTEIMMYFFPWILLSAAFSVIQSILKTMSHYKWALFSELLSMFVSLVYIFIRRTQLHISDIPISNTIGIFCAILFTTPVLFQYLDGSAISLREVVPIIRRIFKQYISNQLSILTSFLERFIFSYLPPGGIAAIGLVTQITISASSLLSFREIYIYPLIRAKDRTTMYKRLMEGLFSLSSVCFGFLIFNSAAVLSVLFEYGHFKSDDVALTSQLLTISSVFLIISTLSTPIYRMLIVENKNRLVIGYHILTLLLYLIAYGSLYLSNQIAPPFIVGSIGIVSWGTSIYLIKQLKTLHINVKLSESFSYFALFFISSSACSLLVSLILSDAKGIMVLLVRGVSYAALMSILLLMNRKKILSVIRST